MSNPYRRTSVGNAVDARDADPRQRDGLIEQLHAGLAAKLAAVADRALARAERIHPEPDGEGDCEQEKPGSKHRRECEYASRSLARPAAGRDRAPGFARGAALVTIARGVGKTLKWAGRRTSVRRKRAPLRQPLPTGGSDETDFSEWRACARCARRRRRARRHRGRLHDRARRRPASPRITPRSKRVRGQSVVRPIDASAPTVLNGRQITQETPLKPGDLVLFGRVGCRVSSDRPVAATAPPPSARKSADEAARTRVRNTLPKFMLRGVSGATFGKTFALTGTMVIGRQADSDIPVPAEEISRHHARLQVTADGVLVEDMNSANGTFINDKRVQNGLLKPGEELRLDTVRFMLVAPGMDAQASRRRRRAPNAAKAAAAGRQRVRAARCRDRRSRSSSSRRSRSLRRGISGSSEFPASPATHLISCVELRRKMDPGFRG